MRMLVRELERVRGIAGTPLRMGLMQKRELLPEVVAGQLRGRRF